MAADRVGRTDKIDGTNARIVRLPDGEYIIGSRTEFLFGRGALIGNPALGIVDCVRDVAERLVSAEHPESITVYFGEVFGGKVTQASKQYTGSRGVAFRLFDVVEIADYAELLGRTREELSAWREAGGQPFLDEESLRSRAVSLEVAVTPRLGTMPALPTALEETLRFLEATVPTTRSAIDDGAGGQPEGIVARTADRASIAKLRFQDYRRTLKRRAKRT